MFHLFCKICKLPGITVRSSASTRKGPKVGINCGRAVADHFLGSKNSVCGETGQPSLVAEGLPAGDPGPAFNRSFAELNAENGRRICW